MRLSLALFIASVAVSLWLTVYGEETRAYLRGEQALVVIDEGGPEQYLTSADINRILNWSESNEFRVVKESLSATDPALFFNNYFITNVGSKDISNGSVEFDQSFSKDGLIASRIRAPFSDVSIGQIDPRRFAWNEFEPKGVGKFSFDVPLLKSGETISVQIISDEFGAVSPTFRAENVEAMSRIHQMVEILDRERQFDWIGFFRIFSYFLGIASAFYLGRHFDEMRAFGLKKLFVSRQASQVDSND